MLRPPLMRFGRLEQCCCRSTDELAYKKHRSKKRMWSTLFSVAIQSWQTLIQIPVIKRFARKAGRQEHLHQPTNRKDRQGPPFCRWLRQCLVFDGCVQVGFLVTLFQKWLYHQLTRPVKMAFSAADRGSRVVGDEKAAGTIK